VQSTMKSARTCDFVALLFSKSITSSDNSIAHFPTLPEES
jgi:hypothetical protein